jgi:exonuclease SbcC
MEYLNGNENNENEKKEYFRLKRELKISKLLLSDKIKELKEISLGVEKLKNENQMVLDKINLLYKEINYFDEKNKILEENNKMKEEEKKELGERIFERKLIPLIPVEEYEQNNFDQINYDNYNIFERDF